VPTVVIAGRQGRRPAIRVLTAFGRIADDWWDAYSIQRLVAAMPRTHRQQGNRAHMKRRRARSRARWIDLRSRAAASRSQARL